MLLVRDILLRKVKKYLGNAFADGFIVRLIFSQVTERIANIYPRSVFNQNTVEAKLLTEKRRWQG